MPVTATSALITLVTAPERRTPDARGDLESLAPAGGCPVALCLWLPVGSETQVMDGRWLASNFPGRCWLAVRTARRPQ
ncbi:MAG: hypothetical protein IPO00_17260 [Betaproteobacteria bacterium]|nr:hypothetical protein [Betaproteobacteria bacterium]